MHAQSSLTFDLTPTNTKMEGIMKGGYESIVWIKDNNGKEYACYADDIKSNDAVKGLLNETDRSRCLDVSEIVGTERW